MKRVLIALTMMALAACGNDANPGPSEPASAPEGLTITRLDNEFADGTYRVAETAIRFEVVKGADFESMRFLDMKGTELFRSELYADPAKMAEERADPTKWGMWHYGVAIDSAKTMEDQPELMQWVNSAEAQLAASIWRDIQASYDYEKGPLNALFRYGVHLEEAMAFDTVGLEDPQEANCACYGKCGPGCFSVGSNWYCTKHDCCCRTYGSASCYSWCFAYPKCPAAICG